MRAGVSGFPFRACAGKLFEDDYVGPTGRFAHVGGLEGGKGTHEAYACWKRPGRGEGLFDRPNLKLFGAIQPNDINQGEVGSCWLLAAIAGLAAYPGMLKRLFLNGTILSKSGRYRIQLWSWRAHAWRTVLLDDRLATKGAAAASALFAQVTEDGEIYVALLEKAVAILCGGYDHIHGGEISMALGMLTGCEDNAHLSRDPASGTWFGFREEFTENRLWTHRVRLPAPRSKNTTDKIYAYADSQNVWPDGSSGDNSKDDVEMWSAMAHWNASNYLMCCGMNSPGKDDSVKHETGLVFGHAYSLIDVRSNVAKSGLDFVLLRNPWGRGEPKLPWHDGDSRWDQHPAVTSALSWSSDMRVEDGTFWMLRSDFFRYFNDFVVVKCDMEGRRPQRREDPPLATLRPF
eukprot:TRINITY_DN80992_c0_g1_i1.p1 TRINITY_DN80992_c0_g1~~TRINITY_DN80992_c0_g1_i1.p1  ORF type:complete len:403 (+),score=50.24 TRINITY_DN80992_c0_g1_i1:665-1873(+)